jgi:hypothetical protein
MFLWVDDVRLPPSGAQWAWARSVDEAAWLIMNTEFKGYPFELIDIDHDAGDYASNGGDYIKLLDWLEETNRNYPIRIHSMNVVGVQNMRAIIQRNQWKEIK